MGIRRFIRKMLKGNDREVLPAGYRYFNTKSVNLSFTKLSYPITESISDDSEGKYIWQFWWQGEQDMPPMVRRSIDSCRSFCPKDYKWILITKDNIKDYIEIPGYILDKVGGGVTLTHLSDYIRLSLLYKYGGLWVDSTCYFTDEIPEDILRSNLFFFQTVDFERDILSLNELSLRTYILNPLGSHTAHICSSWFIKSKKSNYFIGAIKTIIEEYWKENDTLIEYFLIHSAITWVVVNDAVCRKIYSKMPFYSNVQPHMMQGVLTEIEDVELLFSLAKKNSFIHKLTYKLPEKKIKNGSLYEYILKRNC